MLRSHLLVAVIVTGLFGCIPFGDAWLRFEGRVVDESGTPVGGAIVSVLVNGTSRGEAVTTNDRGEYRFFEGSCPCDFAFELRVTKAGYEPHVLRLRGRAANALRAHDVRLRAHREGLPADARDDTTD